MKTISELSGELSALARKELWPEIRGWFSYWDDDDERIRKAVLWMRFFLPHYFRDPTPAFQFELVRAILSDKNEYFAFPRGFGKTTTVQGCICFLAATAAQSFIVIIEKSFREASEVLEIVRQEFSENPMIRQVYGDLVSATEKGIQDESLREAQGDVTVNGVRLRAKGFNTPIRGLKSRQYRPSLIILDDVEEDEHIRSEDQRRKYMENFTQGIIPALDIGGSVKIFGTILHKDSLLNNLVTVHDGNIYMAARDVNDIEGTLIWPERWTYQRLMEKKKQMEMEGLGERKFWQEYFNIVQDDERRPFKWEWLQRAFVDDDLKHKTVNRYIAIDAAESKNDGADYTGVVVVDVDSDNHWYVQLAKRYRVNSVELVNLIFELWAYWKPLRIGIEKNAFSDQITPWLKVKTAETGIFPSVLELEDLGKRKEDRVVGALQGRLESGKISFKDQAPDDTHVLKMELYDFPMGKFDDLADALAYIASMAARPFKAASSMSKIDQEFFAYKKRQMARISSKF